MGPLWYERTGNNRTLNENLNWNYSMVYNFVPFGMALYWLLLGAVDGQISHSCLKSIICAHTQQDGQHTVALSDSSMDSCNTYIRCRGRGLLAVVWSLETLLDYLISKELYQYILHKFSFNKQRNIPHSYIYTDCMFVSVWVLVLYYLSPYLWIFYRVLRQIKMTHIWTARLRLCALQTKWGSAFHCHVAPSVPLVQVCPIFEGTGSWSVSLTQMTASPLTLMRHWA